MTDCHRSAAILPPEAMGMEGRLVAMVHLVLMDLSNSLAYDSQKHRQATTTPTRHSFNLFAYRLLMQPG